MSINCSGLDDRQGGFAAYIFRLSNATNGDYVRATYCKAEVCSALWGNGNPDISGVGMTVGYISSSVLGALLAATFCLSKSQHFVHTKSAHRLLASFDDCATFFAFSIQIASIVVLARVDYGISAASMGDVTVRITWTVSVLTLLPLLYAILLLNASDKAEDSQPKARSSQERRSLLFTICWACSVYPLMSRMIESFGDSLIGDDPGDAISTENWSILERICLAETFPPSEAEYYLINAFGIIASLTLSLFALVRIVFAGLRKHHPEKAEKYANGLYSENISKTVHRVLLFGIPGLSVTQIWSYMRLQIFQTHVAVAAGTQDSDDQWGFGQIVSVVVFLPVLIEIFFIWYEQGDSEGSVHTSQIELVESVPAKLSSDVPTGISGSESIETESNYVERRLVAIGARHTYTWPQQSSGMRELA